MNIQAPITASPALLHPPRDAFARMNSWAEDLPGWCDRTEPVAVALQAAEWIRIVYGELEDWHAGAEAAEAHAQSHKFDRIVAELSGELKPYHHRISERTKSALPAIRDYGAPKKKQPAERPLADDASVTQCAHSSASTAQQLNPRRPLADAAFTSRAIPVVNVL